MMELTFYFHFNRFEWFFFFYFGLIGLNLVYIHFDFLHPPIAVCFIGVWLLWKCVWADTMKELWQYVGFTTSDAVFKQCMKLNESNALSVCKHLCKILFCFALWNQTFISQMKSS